MQDARAVATQHSVSAFQDTQEIHSMHAIFVSSLLKLKYCDLNLPKTPACFSVFLSFSWFTHWPSCDCGM